MKFPQHKTMPKLPDRLRRAGAARSDTERRLRAAAKNPATPAAVSIEHVSGRREATLTQPASPIGNE